MEGWRVPRTSTSVGGFLRRFYSRLPIIRELRDVSATTAEIQRDVHRIATAQLVKFLQFDLMRNPCCAEPKRLFSHAHQVFSQNGEDGIIAEIVRRAGVTDWTFVEIGVGNGLENNTTALLLQGWSGWWVDADRNFVASIQTNSGILCTRAGSARSRPV